MIGGERSYRVSTVTCLLSALTVNVRKVSSAELKRKKENLRQNKSS